MSSTPSIKSSTDPPKLKIVKLGGSLLELPDHVNRLHRLLATVPAPVIVVGGGPSADLVRQWNADGLVNGHEAHWLAIGAMSLNGRRLEQQHSRFELASSHNNALEVLKRSRTPILDVFSLLRVHPGFSTLPETWDITSDSISAFIAREWNAALCLLKSVDPGSNPMEHLDSAFPGIAAGLKELEWVNLRADTGSRGAVRLSAQSLQTYQAQTSNQ